MTKIPRCVPSRLDEPAVLSAAKTYQWIFTRISPTNSKSAICSFWNRACTAAAKRISPSSARPNPIAATATPTTSKPPRACSMKPSAPESFNPQSHGPAFLTQLKAQFSVGFEFHSASAQAVWWQLRAIKSVRHRSLHLRSHPRARHRLRRLQTRLRHPEPYANCRLTRTTLKLPHATLTMGWQASQARA